MGGYLCKTAPARGRGLLLRLRYGEVFGWLREDVRFAEVCRPALGRNVREASCQRAGINE
jgi:hypothetical protein